MDCLFCKIIAGEVPSKKIYEDDKVLAILDAFPNVDGHTLIIPKKHYADFLEMPDELIMHINGVCKKIAPILIKKINAESFSMRVNYGTMQAIKHYHLHLLPDYDIKKKATKKPEEIYELLKNITF